MVDVRYKPYSNMKVKETPRREILGQYRHQVA